MRPALIQTKASTASSGDFVQFDYVIQKIRNAPLKLDPFPHFAIDNLFTPTHFEAIVNAPEIKTSQALDDNDLFASLFDAGYQIIEFPGCVTDMDHYLRWHSDRTADRATTSSSCEGFGVTLRLKSPQTPIVAELSAFLASEFFTEELCAKFEVDRSAVRADMGFQKYLDGYEISPHPDIRQKAATYMVNINPHADSPRKDHHTHYMRFKPGYRYIQAFWEGNPRQDRCWVPWDWCETIWQQSANNSLVMFSPRDDTIHAVRANYDHLSEQRTQIYGNLWYHEHTCEGKPTWEQFVIREQI